MSAGPYNRWYIVPAVQDGDADATPKYRDRDGIAGASGNVVDPSVVEPSYAGLIAQYLDVSEWYIVRFYGTWAALNEISVLGDTRNLATNPSDVAAVLNQRFPDLDRSAEEWADGFFVGKS